MKCTSNVNGTFVDGQFHGDKLLASYESFLDGKNEEAKLWMTVVKKSIKKCEHLSKISLNLWKMLNYLYFQLLR